MFVERPFLATIDQRLQSSSATITVTLGFGDEQFEGTVTGSAVAPALPGIPGATVQQRAAVRAP